MNRKIYFIYFLMMLLLLTSCSTQDVSNKPSDSQAVVSEIEKQTIKTESTPKNDTERLKIGNTDGNLKTTGFYAFEGNCIYTIQQFNIVYKIDKDTKKAVELFSVPKSETIFRLSVMEGDVYTIKLNQSYVRIDGEGQIIKWSEGKGLETLDLGSNILTYRLVNNQIFYITNENKEYKLYAATIQHGEVLDNHFVAPISMDKGNQPFLMTDIYDKRIYFVSDGYLSYIQVGCNEVKKTIEAKNIVEGVADSEYFYYVKNSESGIFKVDKRTYEETQISHDQAGYLNLSNNYLIFSYGVNSFAKLNLQDNSFEDIQLADNDGVLIQISGDTIYYDVGDGAIREQNIVTGTEVLLVTL